MSAPTIEPTDRSAAVTEDRAPRRGRRWPLLVGGAAIAVLVVAWLLAPQAAAFTPSGDLEVRDAQWATLAQFEGGMELLKYEHQADATIAVPVRNDGPLPVTITGVELTDENLPMFEVVDGGEPVRLGAGEVGELVVRGRFDHCKYYTERAMQLYPSATIHFQTLGRAGSTEVVLDRQLAVRSPTIVDCPDRVMDRGYNRRNP
ncbi:MAG: hypothetical protein R3343_06630 [Nitriliruptorales bacterium]|nr:hypothetical protein [Nitriliruptorales bacterium]